MDVKAVADLTREPGQTGVDARYVDRDLRVIYWARVEERRHQGVPVELALELEWSLVLERIPDLMHGQDVLSKARGGLLPGHREAAGNMGLDLRAEAEHEASIGEVLEIPGSLRRLHRRTREGDSDRGAELDLARLVCGYGQWQERVVFRLAGPQARETEVFGRAGGPVHPFQVLALGPEAGIEFHGIVLRDK